MVHMQDIFKGGMEVFTLALRYNTPPPPKNREQMSKLRAFVYIISCNTACIYTCTVWGTNSRGTSFLGMGVWWLLLIDGNLMLVIKKNHLKGEDSFGALLRLDFRMISMHVFKYIYIIYTCRFVLSIKAFYSHIRHLFYCFWNII